MVADTKKAQDIALGVPILEDMTPSVVRGVRLGPSMVANTRRARDIALGVPILEDMSPGVVRGVRLGPSMVADTKREGVLQDAVIQANQGGDIAQVHPESAAALEPVTSREGLAPAIT